MSNKYIEKIAKFDLNKHNENFGVKYNFKKYEYEVANEKGRQNLIDLYDRNHINKGLKTFAAAGSLAGGALGVLKGKGHGFASAAKKIAVGAGIGMGVGGFTGATLAHLGNKQMEEESKIHSGLHGGYQKLRDAEMRKHASDLAKAKEYEEAEDTDIRKYTEALKTANNPKLVEAIKFALPEEKQHAAKFKEAVKDINKK